MHNNVKFETTDPALPYLTCVLVKLTTASMILDLQIAENYSSECQTWIIGAHPPTSQQYCLRGTMVKSSDCSRLCILHNEKYLAIPCQFKMLLRG